MNETTNQGAVITRERRKMLGLSYRGFAGWLTEKIVDKTLSQTSVQNWETGVSEPKMSFLFLILISYDDERAEWAIDMLCAMMPEAFTVTLDKHLVVMTEWVMSMREARE